MQFAWWRFILRALAVHLRKRETFSERDTSHFIRTKIWLRPLVPIACITRPVVLRQVLLDRDPGALHRSMLAPAVRLQEQMDACISICLPL